VIEAATDRAEQVIFESTQTVVPSDYFARLLKALDEPPRTIDALARAAERARLEPAFKQVS
jgi:uncharacterized protein (DUF1778 family)